MLDSDMNKILSHLTDLEVTKYTQVPHVLSKINGTFNCNENTEKDLIFGTWNCQCKQTLEKLE